MLMDIDLDQKTTFRCPVFVIVGEHDYATSHTVAEAWFHLHGNGDGTFGTAASYAAGFGSGSSLITGDFNRDGRLDLALATTINGVASVGILINAGSSGFQLQQGCAAPQYAALVAADFNQDGKLDNGSAQISTATLASGSHTITATYASSASYLTSMASLGQTMQ